MSWINDLDACASAGVLEFDAPAYIKGTQARYFGHPELENIQGTLPEMKKQPKKDEFTKGDPVHHNPVWKKVLLGAIAIAGAILIGNKFTKGNFLKSLGTKFTQIPQKLIDLAKSGFEKFKGLFKKSV